MGQKYDSTYFPMLYDSVVFDIGMNVLNRTADDKWSFLSDIRGFRRDTRSSLCASVPYYCRAMENRKEI